MTDFAKESFSDCNEFLVKNGKSRLATLEMMCKQDMSLNADAVSKIASTLGNDLQLADTDALARKDLTKDINFVAYSGYGDGIYTCRDIMVAQTRSRDVLFQEHGQSLRSGIKDNLKLQAGASHDRKETVKALVENNTAKSIRTIEFDLYL